MNDLPISAALKAPAPTPQAAAASAEQAEPAGATPLGADSFKAVLRKELGQGPGASAATPGPPLAQEDLASEAQSASAAQAAQAAATAASAAAATATADATLAMLWHAQAGLAAAQAAIPTVQTVNPALPAGSPASPRVELADALWSAMPSQEASQAKPGSIEPGWMAGAPRKAVFDLAAAVSAEVQPSLADGCGLIGSCTPIV